MLVDARPERRFVVLGSASPELLRQGAETLAGRIAWIEIPPLTLAEVGTDALDAWWTRGGFPRSFLAASDEDSVAWREDFVRTFVERDLQALGPNLPPVALRRLWTMLAHTHGQTWNGADFGRAFGVSDHTVRRWPDVMSGALVVRQLAPWHLGGRGDQHRHRSAGSPLGGLLLLAHPRGRGARSPRDARRCARRL